MNTLCLNEMSQIESSGILEVVDWTCAGLTAIGGGIEIAAILTSFSPAGWVLWTAVGVQSACGIYATAREVSALV